VADAAHELRSPLAALKLQLEGLKRSADTSTRDIAMGRLTSGIDRATRLVEQLLVLARHEEGIVNSMPRENLSLSEFTKQAVADVAALARERSIDIGITTADEGSILVAKDALGILLGNVLSNAIKYTPDGGTVDVAVVRTANELQLRIDDSGPGIPSSERERVLDRFYRIAGASASGSGLGLSIVKSIVEFHGASLSLSDSEKLGGLKVCIAFPVVS
jgi:two-component system OmpR family sensor kinase